jgi:uncharacterized protein (DUF1501 family)
MTANKKDPVLVILQMSGAYDALNTFIPYSDPRYMEYRPTLKVDPEDVLAVDDEVGFHPSMAPLKALYDEGKVAVLQGIGYPKPIRSHFRSMDIWHTAEPEKVITEGWLGKAIRDIDPQHENVLTAVNTFSWWGSRSRMALPNQPSVITLSGSAVCQISMERKWERIGLG